MDHRSKHKTFRGKSVCGLGLGTKFLDMTPKAQSINENLDQLDLTKIQNVCSPPTLLKE